MMPVIQNVAVANKHIHSPAMGPYMLADAKPVSENDDVEATVEGVPDRREPRRLQRLRSLLPVPARSPLAVQILELLLEVGVPKNRSTTTTSCSRCSQCGPSNTSAGLREVHRPGAGALHHASDESAMMLDVDELIRKHELLERDLRAKTGDDETAAITALADEIGRCGEFGESRRCWPRARGGLSLEGAGEALSVGGSTLFLRSKTGNPMDVHINTGANTRRYLLRQPELSRRIKAAGAADLEYGPEVRMAQRMLASDVQPRPSAWRRCRPTRNTSCSRSSRASSAASGGRAAADGGLAAGARPTRSSTRLLSGSSTPTTAMPRRR